MDSLITYTREVPVAVVQLDDGKANVLSPRMLAALNAALAVCRQRLVAADELRAEALRYAQRLAELDLEAHARTKLRVRAKALRAIRRGLAADMRELTLLGVRRMIKARFGGRRAE